MATAGTGIFFDGVTSARRPALVELASDGLVAAAVTPDEFGTLLRSEAEKWGALAKAKGIKAE